MIADITLTAKPTALQVPEDIASNDDRRADFFVELAQFGATGIDWMGGDDFAIPHIAFNDHDGNLSVAFLGEYLVKFGTFPEIQVYSEQRFFDMFAVVGPNRYVLTTDEQGDILLRPADWASKADDVYTGI